VDEELSWVSRDVLFVVGVVVVFVVLLATVVFYKSSMFIILY
jgi:hypothetical protein